MDITKTSRANGFAGSGCDHDTFRKTIFSTVRIIRQWIAFVQFRSPVVKYSIARAANRNMFPDVRLLAEYECVRVLFAHQLAITLALISLAISTVRSNMYTICTLVHERICVHMYT